MTKHKVISLFLCMGLLVSGCMPGNAGQTETVGTDLVSMNPTPDLSYEVPVSVPHILVDQIGYPSYGEKTAIFTGSSLPEEFEVIDAGSGEVVFRGQVKERERGKDIKESIGYGDFSELTTPGAYYIQSSVLGRSYEFVIGEDVYDALFVDAIARLGTRQEKKINVILPSAEKEPSEKIMQGGWFTDEEGNQDVLLSSEVIMAVLTAYELYPESFTGTDPEAEPVLLTYLRQQTEWMMMLQEEKSGGIYGGIVVENDKAIPVYHATDLNVDSSAAFVAALAKFSYFYKKYDPQYAAQCLKAADRAWKYISKQTDTAKISLRFAAAAELYRASGQQLYHLSVKQILAEGVKPGESAWDTYGTVTYLTTRSSVDVGQCEIIMKQLMNCAEDISSRARASAYFTDGNADYSNTKELLWNMVILSVADYVITNHEYATVIENHQHFFLGCNPDGICLATGDGCDRIRQDTRGIQEDLLLDAYYICMLGQIMKEEK